MVHLNFMRYGHQREETISVLDFESNVSSFIAGKQNLFPLAN